MKAYSQRVKIIYAISPYVHKITTSNQRSSKVAAKSVNMYMERAQNDYEPQKSLPAPNQENYYSTIARRKEILNIATLAMSSSVYANPDKVKAGQGDMHLEPMYIDVVERSKPRKRSRKMKCLVAWMVMLTIISLASLAFTTIIFYKASVSSEKAKLHGNSDSSKDGEVFRNMVEIVENLRLFTDNLIKVV